MAAGVVAINVGLMQCLALGLAKKRWVARLDCRKIPSAAPCCRSRHNGHRRPTLALITARQGLGSSPILVLGGPQRATRLTLAIFTSPPSPFRLTFQEHHPVKMLSNQAAHNPHRHCLLFISLNSIQLTNTKFNTLNRYVSSKDSMTIHSPRSSRDSEASGQIPTSLDITLRSLKLDNPVLNNEPPRLPIPLPLHHTPHHLSSRP